MCIVINLICKECNKPFIRKKGKETLFCSKECKSAYQIKLYNAYIEKPCECCGIIFKSKKKENKKFCSYKCAGQNKKNISREIKHCKTCGKIFEERIKRVKNFCSKKCVKEWQIKPENIKLRLERAQKILLKKYGTHTAFQIDKFQTKAQNTHKINGYSNNEAIIKLKEKREKKLYDRFFKLGYKILEFKNNNIIVQHPDGHIFKNNRKLLVNRLNKGIELSTILQPIGSPRTTFERKICKLLDDNNVTYITNTRKIIDGELDIYIPNFNLAIEVNGLYWHSDKYLPNNYHLLKTEKCFLKNIELLHFFEDELLEKYNIVESIIKNKLNIFNKEYNIQDCNVMEVVPYNSNTFLNLNHIEGDIKTDIRIGLYYNNELISIIVLNKLSNNKYQILRFCDKINAKIIGSLSLLLKYVNNRYSPNQITYYHNKQYGINNELVKLGFKIDHIIAPNYFYVNGKKRVNNNTNLPKIYDSGSIKYIYEK